LAQAALGNQWQTNWGEPNPAAVELLEEALIGSDGETDATRAMLFARLADLLTYTNPDRASGLAGEAVDIARRSEDLTTVAYALHISYWLLRALGDPADVPERATIVHEVVSVAEQSGDRNMLYYGYDVQQAEAAESGDRQALDRALRSD
jgi:hypothetical protein